MNFPSLHSGSATVTGANGLKPTLRLALRLSKSNSVMVFPSHFRRALQLTTAEGVIDSERTVNGASRVALNGFPFSVENSHLLVFPFIFSKAITLITLSGTDTESYRQLISASSLFVFVSFNFKHFYLSQILDFF